MKENVVRIGYPAAILSALIVLVVGGALGWVIPAWAGMRGGNAVPVYVNGRGPAPAAGPPDSMGFAGVVKNVLPAVVNISSSRLVKPQVNALNPFFNDPFFRQFFGGRRPSPARSGRKPLGRE